MSSPNREEAPANVASGSDAGRHAGAVPAGALRPATGLSPEEEAFQEALLQEFHAKLVEEVAREFPNDERLADLAVQNTMAQARRRIPKRVVAEGLYWSLKAKLARFTASVSSVMCETGEDGSLTPDGQAKAELYLQKWDEDLKPKLDDVKIRLDGSYYGYNKFDDDLLAKLDQNNDEVFQLLGPLRRPAPRRWLPPQQPRHPRRPRLPPRRR